MALKLPKLPSGYKIINRDGSPTNTFQIWWQNVASQIEGNINAINAALEAAGIALDAAAVATAAAEAAQTAADAAQTAADNANTGNAQTAAEVSIVNSGVINEAGPISVSTAGTVNIANHDRRYGDPALNPTVPVTGDIVLTSFLPGDQIFVYYDDPARAGGAVTYLFSTNIDDAVQGGNRHTVGSVVVPGAGSQTGFYTRPPGIVG